MENNLTHPDQQVLGFFEATSVKSKRIFVKKVENLHSLYNDGCGTEGLQPRRTGLKGIPKTMYPAYLLAGVNSFIVILLENQCYDCRAAGGDTIKPSFWPY